MLKRLAALFLSLILVLSLFGCAAKPEEKDAVGKFLEERKEPQGTFVGFGKEPEEMNDPLTICMDLEFAHEQNIFSTETVLNDFLFSLENTGGLSEVQIQFVPNHGHDRESMLDRLRVEIMSGGGPDVFIMNCAESYVGSNFNPAEDPLFIFPEKAMENGLFLPLDTYMENNTRFTEWEKLTQPVLEAGRNEEGQLIVPLAYTLPVIAYSKSDLELDLTGAAYTWDEMFTNPEISPYVKNFSNCINVHWDNGSENPGIGIYGWMFANIFGKIADYEEEELCFTEEELLAMVQQSLDAVDAVGQEKDALKSYQTSLGINMGFGIGSELEANENDGATMIPLYSKDGGANAAILSWAAINRNTRKPEEAYTVIDVLLSKSVQKNSWLYVYINMTDGVTMHEDILHPDHPQQRFGKALTPKVYDELCEVRSQISGAHFRSKFTAEIDHLLDSCYYGVKGMTGDPEFGEFESVEQSVHETYERMQRMLRE